ncbi:Ubiquitin fusion degradation protein 4 [Mortierella antarctica]|nr:Ubiquitin fusion degradation protein 4 [Mortierella antarctica]
MPKSRYKKELLHPDDRTHSGMSDFTTDIERLGGAHIPDTKEKNLAGENDDMSATTAILSASTKRSPHPQKTAQGFKEPRPALMPSQSASARHIASNKAPGPLDAGTAIMPPTKASSKRRQSMALAESGSCRRLVQTVLTLPAPSDDGPYGASGKHRRLEADAFSQGATPEVTSARAIAAGVDLGSASSSTQDSRSHASRAAANSRRTPPASSSSSWSSHVITRHQAKVSSAARQDYITFSAGIDGTCSAPFSNDSAASLLSSSTTRKRTWPEASLKSQEEPASNQGQNYGQSQSPSQSRSGGEIKSDSSHRSKHPRLNQPSHPPSNTAYTPSPAVPRARTRSTGRHRKQTQGIATFMRQSKMSTSQKRSNPCTKPTSKDSEDCSSLCQDGTVLDNSDVPDDCDSALGGVEQETETAAQTEDQDQDQDMQETQHPDKQEKEDDAEDDKNEEEEGHKKHDAGNDDDEEDEDEDEEEEDEDDEDAEDDEDDEEEYDRHHHDHDGLFSSGGSLGGMISGGSSRLKGILANLRAYEDPSLQLIALQELALQLSMATEDNLAGYFSCDAFVKELVILLRGSGDGDDNAEMMLLACRCLSNLMEAMPASVGSVVYGGAVPILCSKLIEIQYIDLAEQSLTRTAVKTAANCCRGIQHDSISMVQDILSNLENLLRASDQKIVEQACLCFVRLADSYKSKPSNLQTIITESILREILFVLSPNSKGVGSNIYTHLLHFLGTIAEHSPVLGFALLEMDIVDTLFLILTGTSAPNSFETEGGGLQVPSISRSKDQVIEILGIITELLPPLPKNYRYRGRKEETDSDKRGASSEDIDTGSAATNTEVDRRIELLAAHPDRALRLSRILIPTLIEVYSSTVHVKVRQRAIHSLLRLMHYTSDGVLTTALRDVKLASFLAVILAQQEHQSLVVAALQICDILMTKLPLLYRSYLEREGATFEISKLACLGVELSFSKESKEPASSQEGEKTAVKPQSSDDTTTTVAPAQVQPSDLTDSITENMSSVAAVSQKLMRLMTELRTMRDCPDREQTMNEQLDAIESELEETWSRTSLTGSGDVSSTGQSSSISGSTTDQLRTLQRFFAGGSRSVFTASKDERGLGTGKTKDWIFERSRLLVEKLQNDSAGEGKTHQTTSVLADLRTMADSLGNAGAVKELAGYLSRVGAIGITSFEFLTSGLIPALLRYLTEPDSAGALSREDRIRVFIEEFIMVSKEEADNVDRPFTILVTKIQETLTRMETFEVEAAQSSLGDLRNGPSSSLATQVRLKLSPEDGTDAPATLQNLVVSIHAIATFRTLDEYLRSQLMRKQMELEKASSSRKTGEDSSSKDRGMSGPTKDAPPITRRSSRLQKLTSPAADENPDGEAEPEPEPSSTKEQRQAETSCSEDSCNDTDEGDIEDMDYEFERRASVHSAVGVESSSIVVDSDIKMDDTPHTSPNDGPQDSNRENGSTGNGRRRSKRSAKQAPPKKADSAAASSPSSSPWQIQFSLHGTPISTDTTVYGAIHEYERRGGKSASQRSMWSSVYPIKFKRVDTPPAENSEEVAHVQSQDDVDLTFTSQMPKELPQQADYAPILGLLRVLHGLNDDWRRFFATEDTRSLRVVRPLESSKFVNSKISAKVNRQLEEPLIVASSCLPNWTVGLIKGFPFLFPFETRFTYLQSTAFGFSRSIMRWQNQQQRNGHTDQRDDSQTFLGRIQRQKVRISREKALESAVKVMELYGASQGMLEVEYFDEVGTGLGPTLEFYSVVSKEFCKKAVKLWRDVDSEALSDYVLAPQGLYPRPMACSEVHSDNEKKILKLFRSLGQFIAKAMLDSRIIDVPLSALFVSQLLGRSRKPRLQLVASIDPVLAQSLRSLQLFVVEKKRVYSMNLPSKEREVALKNIELDGSRLEDMSLDFTLPGYSRIDLKTGGANIPVTIYNVEEYIELAVDMTVGRGIQAQVAAFQEGFNRVFSIQDLAGFRSEELVNLFGSGEEDWSYETLMDSIKADHGFRSDSPAFINLLQVMSEFSMEERRQFLQFITGSPKLPIGGFKNLHPPFTVVCKHFPQRADDYLPSVMTCANYLKMPEYSCKEVTLAKFRMAYEEGQGSFHLS